MAKLSLLCSLSVCFLILFHAQAYQQSQRQSRCQVQNINALEPTQNVQSEAGETEHWDQNNEQLECAGVSVTRHTIQPRGLLLPHYHNAPKLTYVTQGRGMHGAAIPGCPETFQSSRQYEQQQQPQYPSEQGKGQEEPSEQVQGQEETSEQGQGQEKRYTQGDQHQKVRQIRQGDIVASPVGVANWFYNDGETPLVLVTLLDTSNNENQLDDNRRTFYLGGNPQEQRQQQGGSPFQQPPGSQQESSSGNILTGMDKRILAAIFGVRQETVSKLMGENDNRGSIVQVENGLGVIRPPRVGEQEQEKEEPQGRPNRLEESLCNMRLRINIDNPSHVDVYNPQAGRINRINSRKLPILRAFNLNVERGVLYRNALMVPHWNLNAHSIIYATRGSAQVQIVGNYEKPIYDGELKQDQLIVVPQNFAVVKKAKDQGFEWVAFKTNDNAIVNPLAGMTSAIRAMPEAIIQNSFRVSNEEAKRIKYNTEELELLAPRVQSEQRDIA
ncbi:12S seed storage globulin [Thalictrum thalictroides]|uniref:12S seed storage globulin n=1 Tax=Thalictrum thalictroides TaxID=46969 RepID=A0A7J6UTJ9_THATH|nr:12S seed storage globulin [Thalictrum thalictroides]